jgi:hypothetical protein
MTLIQEAKIKSNFTNRILIAWKNILLFQHWKKKSIVLLFVVERTLSFSPRKPRYFLLRWWVTKCDQQIHVLSSTFILLYKSKLLAIPWCLSHMKCNFLFPKYLVFYTTASNYLFLTTLWYQLFPVLQMVSGLFLEHSVQSIFEDRCLWFSQVYLQGYSSRLDWSC